MATAALWAFEHALADLDIAQLPQILQDELFDFLAVPPAWPDAWKVSTVVAACGAWRATVNQQAQGPAAVAAAAAAAAAGVAAAAALAAGPQVQAPASGAAAAAGGAAAAAAAAAAAGLGPGPQGVPGAQQQYGAAGVVPAGVMQAGLGAAAGNPVFDAAVLAAVAVHIAGLSRAAVGGGVGRRPPPPEDHRLTETAGDPWWKPASNTSTGVRPERVDTVDLAQHSILEYNGLGPADRPGASTWAEFFQPAACGSFLEYIVTEGLATGASETERAGLRSALLRFIPLFVNPDEQITAAERQELKDARKAENSKQRAAAPSLAGVPWLQRLMVEPTRGVDPWLAGRRLAVAMRVDPAPLVEESWERTSRAEERVKVVKRMQQDTESGNVSAVLLAVQAFKKHVEKTARTVYAESRGLLMTYPLCVQLLEMCAGRQQQTIQLPVMWEQMAVAATIGEEGHAASDEWMLGFWSRFIEGFVATSSASATVQAAILLRGQEVMGGVGGTSGGTGGGVAQGAAVSGGGGATPTAKLGSGAGAAAGGGAGGSAQAVKPPGPTAGGNSLVIFKHAPVSKEIIGTVIGRDEPPTTCWECNTTGHFKGECPVAWGRAGRPLPGWDKNGKRIPGAWNKKPNEPKRETHKQWVKFLMDKKNFPSGQAEIAALEDAPDMSEYKQRAREAPL